MDSAERVLIIPANQVTQVAAVLSSELRKNIVTLLYGRKLNINEIAQELRIPQSTCATNVQMLERAGLIQTVQMPAGRGAQKVCTS
ncbi:MAG TPA: helix-turn-helix domain-containing protein, partial [Spirochaetia bacterium]|nr:helix-turn-helix domain-containing protein [Spirochaetia bacterium]